MASPNFNLTLTELRAGWRLKYSDKNGILCDNKTLERIVEVSKHRIGTKTTWSASYMIYGGHIKDIDDLTNKRALELTHALMINQETEGT